MPHYLIIDDFYLYLPAPLALIVTTAVAGLAKCYAWRVLSRSRQRRECLDHPAYGRHRVPGVWVYHVELAYAPVACMMGGMLGMHDPVADSIASRIPAIQGFLFAHLVLTWVLALGFAEYMSQRMSSAMLQVQVADWGGLQVTFWRLHIFCSAYICTLFWLFALLFYGGLRP